MQVPGNVAGLLELRLGRIDRAAGGYAAHVPHYVSQTEYEHAAVCLIDAVAAHGRLELPTLALREAAERKLKLIEAQIAAQPEVAALVRALEEQYAAFLRGRDRPLLQDAVGALPEHLPTAEELGAELERYLVEENERRGRGDPRP